MQGHWHDGLVLKGNVRAGGVQRVEHFGLPSCGGQAWRRRPRRPDWHAVGAGSRPLDTAHASQSRGSRPLTSTWSEEKVAGSSRGLLAAVAPSRPGSPAAGKIRERERPCSAAPAAWASASSPSASRPSAARGRATNIAAKWWRSIATGGVRPGRKAPPSCVAHDVPPPPRCRARLAAFACRLPATRADLWLLRDDTDLAICQLEPREGSARLQLPCSRLRCRRPARRRVKRALHVWKVQARDARALGTGMAPVALPDCQGLLPWWSWLPCLGRRAAAACACGGGSSGGR